LIERSVSSFSRSSATGASLADHHRAISSGNTSGRSAQGRVADQRRRAHQHAEE
jgi:hypothetical protein